VNGMFWREGDKGRRDIKEEVKRSGNEIVIISLQYAFYSSI
jgi:hypothetical protein